MRRHNRVAGKKVETTASAKAQGKQHVMPCACRLQGSTWLPGTHGPPATAPLTAIMRKQPAMASE